MTKTYYGDETKKALENFPALGIKTDLRLIYALVDVKEATAMANEKQGRITPEISKAIIQACREIKTGQFDDQFVTEAIQGGAGTSINMNVNEVVAARASEILGEKVSDLDHVNASQSTNDSVPTAIKITTLQLIKNCIQELDLLQKTFTQKSEEFNDIIKVGRTHFQDAVPLSLGQEFAAYASL